MYIVVKYKLDSFLSCVKLNHSQNRNFDFIVVIISAIITKKPILIG